MSTKKRINWRQRQARVSNVLAAMELCLEYAREKHNRGIEQVAERMGIPSHWTLYKYVGEGRLPTHLIRSFEFACDCTFLTEFLAASAHKIIIDIPSGKKAGAKDINALQANFTDVIGALIKYYESKESADIVLGRITQAMADLAAHRANIQCGLSPELALFGDEECKPITVPQSLQT